MTSRASATICRSILVGAGGHARVLLSTLLQTGSARDWLCRSGQIASRYCWEFPILAAMRLFWLTIQLQVLLVNGVGSVASISNRLRVYEYFRNRGYRFASVIHPARSSRRRQNWQTEYKSWPGRFCRPGVSSRKTASSTREPGSTMIALIEAHAHVAPGAVLSGGVHVGVRAHVGAGATVIQGVHIGYDSVVGAGAVVLSDVPESCTVVGVPARPIPRESVENDLKNDCPTCIYRPLHRHRGTTS